MNLFSILFSIAVIFVSSAEILTLVPQYSASTFFAIKTSIIMSATTTIKKKIFIDE